MEACFNIFHKQAEVWHHSSSASSPLLQVENMTRENVASHLQKYRLYLRRLGGLTDRDRADADALQCLHEQNVQQMAVQQVLQHSLAAMQGPPPGVLAAMGLGGFNAPAQAAPPPPPTAAFLPTFDQQQQQQAQPSKQVQGAMVAAAPAAAGGTAIVAPLAGLTAAALAAAQAESAAAAVTANGGGLVQPAALHAHGQAAPPAPAPSQQQQQPAVAQLQQPPGGQSSSGVAPVVPSSQAALAAVAAEGLPPLATGPAVAGAAAGAGAAELPRPVLSVVVGAAIEAVPPGTAAAPTTPTDHANA